MARKKQAKKTAKAKKSTEKTDKVDIPAHIKGTGVEQPLGIVTEGKEETIEDDQSTLPKKDLFRIDEVAQYFSVTERTVRLWIDHGHLKATEKIGAVRILRESILKCRILEKRESM